MPASITVAALGVAAAIGTALILGQTGAAAPEAPGRAHCRVTVANGSTPPGENPTPDRHGNGKLWTGLSRDGRFVVAPESAPEYFGPDGAIAVDGVLMPDGSVGIKAPWWRAPGVRGRVRLRARRLDAPAPRVDRTIPPSGYGLTGFQAMGLELPTIGCWKITGSVANESLTFVTLIEPA